MQFLQLIISGIAQGCIYGLIALGFVLIYKATETVSFAQGELMMLGAFAGLLVMGFWGYPFWVAVLASLTAMAVTGHVIERAVIHPILGQPAFSVVMLTIGIGYVLRGMVTMMPGIGTDTHTLAVPYKDLTYQWRMHDNVVFTHCAHVRNHAHRHRRFAHRSRLGAQSHSHAGRLQCQW